jgi:hypothetical protein
MHNFTHDEAKTRNWQLREFALKAAGFPLFLFKVLARNCRHVHLIKTLEFHFKSLYNNYS